MKEVEPTSIEYLKAELEQSEKEKASLLKVISHDLRSPMNKLFALFGLFKMSGGTLSAEQAKYLEKMEVVISDGLSNMRNLMDLRTIESNGIKTIYTSIDLSRLIKKIIDEYLSAAKRKNITISFAANKILLESDKLSCLRIIDQLLSNAVKYSPAESTIAIILQENEDEVIVQVIDGGYGIVEEEQKRLFKKFSVLATRTSGGESSTGIGLYIAQRLAKSIGGIIRYANTDKSRFILRLPKTRLA